jgi:tripartite-type tricarboxylate transporter receptor subunit TctC
MTEEMTMRRIAGHGQVGRRNAARRNVVYSRVRHHSVNPSVLPNLPYDTVKDLVPIMLIGTSPMVITAHPGRADKRTNIQLGMTSMAPSRKQCHPQ